jgi:hypothetical protein
MTAYKQIRRLFVNAAIADAHITWVLTRQT